MYTFLKCRSYFLELLLEALFFEAVFEEALEALPFLAVAFEAVFAVALEALPFLAAPLAALFEVAFEADVSADEEAMINVLRLGDDLPHALAAGGFKLAVHVEDHMSRGVGSCAAVHDCRDHDATSRVVAGLRRSAGG